MKNRIDGSKVSLQLDLLEEGDSWIIYSPALDFSSCGKTKEEALKMFDEAVHIFLQELREIGTFEQVLTELGWKKRDKQEWKPPTITHQAFNVCVPA